MIWADPMQDIVCVVLANRVIGNRWPVEKPQGRWELLSNAVMESILD
jgi:hypothetical protein